MTLIQKNQERWNNMHITPSRVDGLANVAKRLINPAAKERYQQIETTTGVPWFVIAVIHEREASQDFTKQLAQGDPLSRVSTHVPKGRGPFLNHSDDPPGHDAFYRGALDALIDCPPYASKWKDWSPGGTLTLLEAYNGLGYANKGLPSPYVWSGTDQYKSGKYIRDGVFSATAVDTQEGCAPLIKIMMQLDPTIKFGPPTTITPIITKEITHMNINWKTTTSGIAAIIAAVGTLFAANGTIDWSHLSTVIPAIIAGVGLIFAKDSDVHSTPAEVKKAGAVAELTAATK
jgi:lysozyme family protein